MSGVAEGIRARYDQIAALSEEDPQAATVGAALAYATDVPALLAEVERLAELVEAGRA